MSKSRFVSNNRCLSALVTCLVGLALAIGACERKISPTSGSDTHVVPTDVSSDSRTPETDIRDTTSDVPDSSGADDTADSRNEVGTRDTTDAAGDVEADAGPGDPPGPTGDRPLRLLFVGNSFTHGGPVPHLVRSVAADAGWPEPAVEYAAPGGYTLERHRDRAATLRKVDRGDWDVVVLQEYSTRPTDNAGDPDRFKRDATWFAERIREHSPDARIVLFETWARHPDHGIYDGTFDSPTQMQAQLRTHYNDAADNYVPEQTDDIAEDDIQVAPVGDAWENHLKEMDAARLHASDDYHAGKAGQYLNALVIYSIIYRRSVEARTALSVAPSTAETLQQVADATTGMTTPGGPDGTQPEPPPALEPGARIRIDFGSADGTTADPWRNMTAPVAGHLDNLRDTDGQTTAIDLAVTDGFNGANEAGLEQNDLGYPSTVSRDTFWVGSFDGHEAGVANPGQLRLTDLAPDATYDLEVFASRAGDDGGRGRSTRYTIGPDHRTLAVSSNTDRTTEFTGLQPPQDGVLSLEVAVDPDGSGRFGYIGAMTIERTE